MTTPKERQRAVIKNMREEFERDVGGKVASIEPNTAEYVTHSCLYRMGNAVFDTMEQTVEFCGDDEGAAVQLLLKELTATMALLTVRVIAACTKEGDRVEGVKAYLENLSKIMLVLARYQDGDLEIEAEMDAFAEAMEARDRQRKH